MSGVYQIYNTVNGKRYIGSSIHIEQRFKEHLRNLRANKHVNAHLQCAWNKYGEQSFILEEVELCEPDQCLKIEQEYIDYYHAADRNFGYNIDPYAEHSGNTLSEETRKKISEKAKGRKWSKERHEKWSNTMTGVKKPKQSETMKQKYSNGEFNMPRFNEVSEEKQKSWRDNLSLATKRRYSDLNNRPNGRYLKVKFSDDVKYYPSLREASRQLGIDKAAISYCFKHKQGYCGKLNCTFIQISEKEYKEVDYEKH